MITLTSAVFDSLPNRSKRAVDELAELLASGSGITPDEAQRVRELLAAIRG